MVEERGRVSPRITPLTEPKQFQPQAYVGTGDMDPYNPQKLTQALRREIHSRLDEATGQLIARYRQDPILALTALPSIRLA